MQLDHKDVWIRAFKTGLVVFAVTLAGSAANWHQLPSVSDLDKLLFAAATAGGTAILNYLLQLSPVGA